MAIRSKHKCLEHYQWGNACDGWTLLAHKDLSVKLEKMPAHTAEAIHYHERAQQFFFILSGTASFETEEGRTLVQAGEGFHIQPGVRHRILNETDTDLEFILSSQPATAGDRINCEQFNAP